MSFIIFYALGIVVGRLVSLPSSERLYINEINQVNDLNIKYKKYIIQKGLLQDWNTYNANNNEKTNIDE